VPFFDFSDVLAGMCLSSGMEMEMAGPDPEKCLQTHSGHPPHYAHESIAEALDRPYC